MIELSKEKFEEIKSGNIVVADFYAVWCGPCRLQSPIMEEVEEYFSDNEMVKICKSDVDYHDMFAEELGIRSIPTIIIFRDGEIAHKFVGLTDKEEIIQKIEENL